MNTRNRYTCTSVNRFRLLLQFIFLRCSLFQELHTVLATVPFKRSTKRRYRLAHQTAGIIGNQNKVYRSRSATLSLPNVSRSNNTDLSKCIILANYYNLWYSTVDLWTIIFQNRDLASHLSIMHSTNLIQFNK